MLFRSRYEAGDKTAMSEAAIRGRAMFKNNQKGRCSICHAGSNLTDEKYHNIGVGMDQADWEKGHAGRYAVTKEEKGKGREKERIDRMLVCVVRWWGCKSVKCNDRY